MIKDVVNGQMGKSVGIQFKISGYFLPFVICLLFSVSTLAKEFSESSFLIVRMEDDNVREEQLWHFLQSDNHSGIEIDIAEQQGSLLIPGKLNVNFLFAGLQKLINQNPAKIVPVFIHYTGSADLLDSMISQSPVASHIFSLPLGEAWPSVEYLMHSDRRILFFIDDEIKYTGPILHQTGDYILQISARPGTTILPQKIHLELLMIDDFNQLPTQNFQAGNIRNMVPDYINFLLDSWTKYGKRPNFIFVGRDILQFDFIISQLNSFTWITGSVRGPGKIMDKVYWKNPDISVTGGRFSFPYFGGQELTLTPFVPGYRILPEQIIVTGEMEVPESYHLMATPLMLSEELTGNFSFDGSIVNKLMPAKIYQGENHSFTRDIERGTVLKLPENSSINLGSPDRYGLRNSSFSVSCFVKFSEILEFGDNAVLGNYESEYRRGLHLILRSGHPYFGLWANDYISEEKLESNRWYHMVWRYIVETGEQAIFVNGRNIGHSTGHPPFSGMGDIYLGSALSQGASLRGYIDDLNIWSRPLGAEEITRLALNEEVVSVEEDTTSAGFLQQDSLTWLAGGLMLIFLAGGMILLIKRRQITPAKSPGISLEKSRPNQVNLFGEFFAVNHQGEDVSALFTPKVKELFLFILLFSVKNNRGVAVTAIDENLWPGLPSKNVTNNRAVTLNKLRKIVHHFEGFEIVTRNGLVQAKMEAPFFCDYAEAFKICQLSGEPDKNQLETFFLLVRRGRFLKATEWSWLDELRGYTGNQVIDNLLKLSAFYIKESNLRQIEAIARRILEYDDLNEDAIWLQVWSLRQSNNIHQARFYFDSFCSKYGEAFKEPYPMNFEQFYRHFANIFK